MSLDTDIARLVLQEERLRFTKFDEADAWALGSQMRAAGLAQKLVLAIGIQVAGRVLFHAALPGSTFDNAEWLRRKANLVMRYHRCSYRISRELQKSGAAFNETRGINPMEYAPAGGSFPIHLAGTGVVGAVGVSGIPQRDDHNFVAEQLCLFLKVPPADVMLGPESP